MRFCNISNRPWLRRICLFTSFLGWVWNPTTFVLSRNCRDATQRSSSAGMIYTLMIWPVFRYKTWVKYFITYCSTWAIDFIWSELQVWNSCCTTSSAWPVVELRLTYWTGGTDLAFSTCHHYEGIQWWPMNEKKLSSDQYIQPSILWWDETTRTWGHPQDSLSSKDLRVKHSRRRLWEWKGGGGGSLFNLF